MEKNFCRVKYKRPVIYNYYIIVDKVKVVLDLSNYGTRKQSDYASGVDTSDLAAKNNLLQWKLKLTN